MIKTLLRRCLLVPTALIAFVFLWPYWWLLSDADEATDLTLAVLRDVWEGVR